MHAKLLQEAISPLLNVKTAINSLNRLLLAEYRQFYRRVDSAPKPTVSFKSGQLDVIEVIVTVLLAL